MKRHYPRILSSGLAVFIGVTALAHPTHAGVKEMLFGLSGENTAYDYMSSPVERSVEWALEMCNDGECIPRVDWYCGFSYEPDEVRECFDRVIGRVQPWVKLDIVRKACGVRVSTFTGEQYGDKARCKKAEGVWGEKSVVKIPTGR